MLCLIRFLEKTLEEWEEIFETSACAYGPVNNMQQVFSNPQVRSCCSRVILLTLVNFCYYYLYYYNFFQLGL